jgi:hypothetical protein
VAYGKFDLKTVGFYFLDGFIKFKTLKNVQMQLFKCDFLEFVFEYYIIKIKFYQEFFFCSIKSIFFFGRQKIIYTFAENF